MTRLLTKLSKRSKLQLAAAATLCCALLHFTSLDSYLYQKNYFTDFSYPSRVNLSRLIGQLRAGSEPEVPPTNPFAFQLLLDCPSKCAAEDRVRVLLVVKSAAPNLANRMAIRRTWGRESRGVLRRIFLLAAPGPADPSAQGRLRAEQALHDDLVQGDFADRYHNNTWKTIMGLKWVRDRCPQAAFVFFVDDDFFVSPKNLQRLLDSPGGYPRGPSPGDKGQEDLSRRHWYTGHLFFVLPVRFTFHRFFVSLQEYPYNVFPPFVNAGAFLVSRHSLLEFYYASLYTSPLKLDDVYVGILAKRVGVQPTHNRYFFPFKVPSSAATYADLIASHGYRDPEELIRVWHQQVLFGNV